jgi:hypothetical protein
MHAKRYFCYLGQTGIKNVDINCEYLNHPKPLYIYVINIHIGWKVLVGRVNPPEAQQTIAPITFFSNTEASQRRAHILTSFHDSTYYYAYLLENQKKWLEMLTAYALYINRLKHQVIPFQTSNI